ncbi:MAG: ACP S-malonyltransferase [Anaerolineae bacterium]|jgi:[acyl-carrier-protein] S-malonyltransferase
MPALALALVFPGQGTQFAGMGRDFWARFPEAQATFQEADEALGENITRLCFEGPDADLERTTNAQPAILTTSIAIWRSLQARTDLQPLAAAGHSLGEYSALVAAGALTLPDALRLVRARAQCMDAAVNQDGGSGMLAILGLDAEAVETICVQAQQATGGHATVANYNCPGQLVVAGHSRALDQVQELAREQGARRVVRLAVAVASHCPLLKEAAQAFASYVEQTPVAVPSFPVVGNADIRPLTDPDEIRSEMVRQLVEPVNWPGVMSELAKLGAEAAWELGPRSVLAGLGKRIPGAPPVRPITTADELEALLQAEERS